MKITFLGATGTVTGSKYLLETGGMKLLIDCGLFQGLKDLRLRNWEDFPVDPASIDAVILTHAHLDHSGYLPCLMKQGFKGPIYSTPGTRDLCRILLPDAGKLQEEEATYANKKGFSKHNPAEPLFSYEDSLAVLRQFKTVEFKRAFDLSKDISLRFDPAGHILGSAIVHITSGGKTISFSGDLGRPEDLIMNPPTRLTQTDYLVIESTYGDRLHPKIDPFNELEPILNKAIARGGVIVVPAFSVGRSQSLLFALEKLISSKRIPSVPVYLNSPMSINAMGVYCDHHEEHRLTDDQCKAMCSIAKYVKSPEESKALNNKKGPMIIVSASGMATGGRVLHHLKEFAPDKKNLILLTGFQAAGTRGEALVNGAKTIKIHGQMIPVNAEVFNLGSYSAHADQAELLNWLKNFKRPPALTFITHGEPIAAKALKEKIQTELNWETKIPEYLEERELL